MLLANIMLILALVILIAGLFAQMRERVRYSPCTFIWGVLFLLLFIVFPLVLNLFFGYGLSIRGDLLTDEAGYIVYGLAILFFSLVYTCSVFLGQGAHSHREVACRPPLHSRSAWQAANPMEKRVFTLCGILVPLGLLIYVRGTGLSLAELMVASRFEWFARETASGFFLILGMYTLGLVAIFIYYDVRFGLPRKWLSFLVYGTILFTIFVAGDRKWLLFMASGAAAGFYDARGGAFLQTRKLAAGLALVGMLVFMLQFGRAVTWEDEASREKAGESVAEVIPVLFVEGDATYFYRASLDAIRLNMDDGVLYPLAIVRRVLLLPLPDTWTGGLKPEGIPFLFSDEFEAGSEIRRGNMPPGLVGLFVLSFGWKLAPLLMASLILPLLGALDRMVKQNSGPLRSACFASYPVAAILLMRGSTGGIYFMVFNCGVTVAALVAFRLVRGLGSASGTSSSGAAGGIG